MTSTSEKISDVQSFYTALNDEWQGRYNLWLNPTAPEQSSESTAKIAKGSDRDSWIMSYHWAQEAQKHQGEFRFTGMKGHGDFSWTDSFHSPSSPMKGKGELSKDGSRLIFMSRYSVGAGQPDWGWRTEIKLIDANSFLMEAYNITPQGKEALAVRCEYAKK